MNHQAVKRLLSGRLATTLTLKRSTQIIDKNGIADTNIETTVIRGVITQNKGAALDREETGSGIKRSITLCTSSLLHVAQDFCDADVITWQGRDYQVVEVDDYLQLAGYVSATCESLSLSG